jgi:hypothetical protein
MPLHDTIQFKVIVKGSEVLAVQERFMSSFTCVP